MFAARRGIFAHPSSLHLLRGHDDDVRVLLIQHLPEVHHCVLQAPLSGDEDFAFIHVASLFMGTLQQQAPSDAEFPP